MLNLVSWRPLTASSILSLKWPRTPVHSTRERDFDSQDSPCHRIIANYRLRSGGFTEGYEECLE